MKNIEKHFPLPIKYFDKNCTNNCQKNAEREKVISLFFDSRNDQKNYPIS